MMVIIQLAMQCDSSINRDNITPVILLAGIEVVFSLFCLFMVIYLSIRLKKKAWDRPAKRFVHFFNVYFALTFFSYASTNFSKGLNFTGFWICYISFPLFHVSFLYYTAIYVAPLLQIVTPFLPEIPDGFQPCIRKTHCVTFSEITCHLLIFLLLASCYVPLYYNTDVGYIIIEISGIILVLFLLFSFVLILTLEILIRFFNNYKKPLKYMSIKIVLHLNCIALIIKLVIDTYWFALSSLFIQMVLYFILLSILIVSLNHPLDIWCCKCHSRNSAPLLPVSDTEGQQTIQYISVSDNRDKPSNTSDCRLDYYI